MIINSVQVNKIVKIIKEENYLFSDQIMQKFRDLRQPAINAAIHMINYNGQYSTNFRDNKTLSQLFSTFEQLKRYEIELTGHDQIFSEKEERIKRVLLND